MTQTRTRDTTGATLMQTANTGWFSNISLYRMPDATFYADHFHPALGIMWSVTTETERNLREAANTEWTRIQETQEPTLGLWTAGKGIYRIVATQDGGRTYAESRTGRRWTYEPGLCAILVRFGSPMNRDEAVAYGRETGRCVVCARTLTDPVSIESGIGPTCAAKQGW